MYIYISHAVKNSMFPICALFFFFFSEDYFHLKKANCFLQRPDSNSWDGIPFMFITYTCFL